MSELMDRAVIGMPYEMAMGDELSRRQFYARAQALLAERDAAQKDAERYRWLRSVGQQQLNAAMHNGGQELDRFVDASLQGEQP